MRPGSYACGIESGKQVVYRLGAGASKATPGDDVTGGWVKGERGLRLGRRQRCSPRGMVVVAGQVDCGTGASLRAVDLGVTRVVSRMVIQAAGSARRGGAGCAGLFHRVAVAVLLRDPYQNNGDYVGRLAPEFGNQLLLALRTAFQKCVQSDVENLLALGNHRF